MKSEIIKEFPEYSIYENGDVWSSKRNKFLKQTINRENGYMRVSLSNELNSKWRAIHRLVAIAFIPNAENKPEVNHIDKNK